MALAGNWPVAALLIVLERVGKATRNPPRDVMLSHAASEIGFGWAFGLHEALDQFGALFGPLAVAAVLALRLGGYRFAFGMLAVPAVIMLSLLGVARLLYPRPEDLESHPPDIRTEGMPRVFWMYLAAGALVAAGFADFPLIAYHFQKASIVSTTTVPILYALAMGVSGAGSLVFGRLFDRVGLRVLVPLTLLSALFAPLVFLGGTRAAIVGASLWGLGMGVHESIVPAAVAMMVPAARRIGVWALHGGIRRRLVPGERGDRRPVRPVARRRRRVLGRRRVGRGSPPRRRRATAPSPRGRLAVTSGDGSDVCDTPCTAMELACRPPGADGSYLSTEVGVHGERRARHRPGFVAAVEAAERSARRIGFAILRPNASPRSEPRSRTSFGVSNHIWKLMACLTADEGGGRDEAYDEI